MQIEREKIQDFFIDISFFLPTEQEYFLKWIYIMLWFNLNKILLTDTKVFSEGYFVSLDSKSTSIN